MDLIKLEIQPDSECNDCEETFEDGEEVDVMILPEQIVYLEHEDCFSEIARGTNYLRNRYVARIIEEEEDEVEIDYDVLGDFD